MRIVLVLIVLTVVAYLTLQQMGGSDEPALAPDAPRIAVEASGTPLASLSVGPGIAAPHGYALQLALEDSSEAALRVAATLVGADQPVRIVKVSDRGAERFLVVVGRYERLDQVQLAQATMIAHVGMQRPVLIILSP